MKYKDLTKAEQKLAFVVVQDYFAPGCEGTIRFIGCSMKECAQWIQDNLLPMEVIDDMYGGEKIDTVDRLYNFLDFHNTYWGYVHFKNKDMKEFNLEIVPEAWYAYECSLIDDREVFYRAAKEYTEKHESEVV